MLNDIILDKLFAHPKMQSMAVGTQANAVKVFEEVLEEIVEENPYANVTELLSAYGTTGVPTDI